MRFSAVTPFVTGMFLIGHELLAGHNFVMLSGLWGHGFADERVIKAMPSFVCTWADGLRKPPADKPS